ncbi:MAG: PadR family transcriptional regulator [Cyclobacteriaceae bacterium]
MKSNEYIKGTIKTIVLKLLSDNKKMYGYEISRRVLELSKEQIKLTYGALYPILYKLESDGFLASSTEIVGNRARKYYALTPKGKKMAKEKVSELQKFTEMLKVILMPSPDSKLSIVEWGN